LGTGAMQITRKPSRDSAKSKAERVIEALCGTANVPMTTDQIMALTRGEGN